MFFVCFAPVLRNFNKHCGQLRVCTQVLMKHTHFENILKLVRSTRAQAPKRFRVAI